MIDFATILPAFAALATKLTGLQQVINQHMPPKQIDTRKKGKLEYRVIACKPIGAADEARYTYDAGSGLFTLEMTGMRQITIQVKFEGYDHTPKQDALFYLERLSDRLVWPSSVAALSAMGLGLVTRTSFLDLSKVLTAEDRQWSIGVKDFIFNAVSCEIPGTDDNPADWIETVIFTSDTLKGEDGNPLSHQITGTVTRP